MLALMLVGCPNKDKGQDTPSNAPPPPPVATAKAGACASGGGEITDPQTAAFFPRSVAGYCIDPQGETRTYGEKGKLSMDEVCTTAVDGECEVYKRYGLKRFVTFRYVDGNGGGGNVEVHVSQFGDIGGGFAMFSKRVIADGDPADPTAPRALVPGGGAALGTGNAYVWKGPYLVELQYINENESPEQIAKSSDPLLTTLSSAIGNKIPPPGLSREKPPSARALPDPNLINANAVQYFPKNALGFTGVSAGAVGFYRDGARRYRLLAIQRDDVDQAKDAMKTIKSKPGALPAAGIGDEAVRVVVQAAPEAAKTEYLIARTGSLVAGIGDEEFAIKPGDPPEKQAAARLPKDEAAQRLKAWIGSMDGGTRSGGK